MLNTDGRGLWSDEKRLVEIVGLVLSICTHDHDDSATEYGELRVMFNRKTWNTEKHGLISDDTFLKELKKYLRSLKLNTTGLDYSEQGMQGDNFVSLDVDNKFINSWRKLTEAIE